MPDPLQQASFKALEDFAAQTAAKTPTPGGGSIAPIVGALGVALASMAVAYSLGKMSLADHQPDLEQAAIQLTRTRQLLFELAQEDVEVYTQLNKALSLPKDNAARPDLLESAARSAAAVPAAVAAAGTNILRLLNDLATKTNPNLRSDLAIAAILSESCVRAAAWNVRVNLPMLTDSAERSRLLQSIEQSVSKAIDLANAIEGACSR